MRYKHVVGVTLLMGCISPRVSLPVTEGESDATPATQDASTALETDTPLASDMGSTSDLGHEANSDVTTMGAPDSLSLPHPDAADHDSTLAQHVDSSAPDKILVVDTVSRPVDRPIDRPPQIPDTGMPSGPSCEGGILCDPSSVEPGRPHKQRATCFIAPASICWLISDLGLLYTKTGQQYVPRNPEFCPTAMRTDGEAYPGGSEFGIATMFGVCGDFLSRAAPRYCAEPLNGRTYYVVRRDYDVSGNLLADSHIAMDCP